MGETILRMHGIQKYFPGVHALDNAQLEVRSGEVVALIGENGPYIAVRRETYDDLLLCDQ